MNQKDKAAMESALKNLSIPNVDAIGANLPKPVRMVLRMGVEVVSHIYRKGFEEGMDYAREASASDAPADEQKPDAAPAPVPEPQKSDDSSVITE